MSDDDRSAILLAINDLSKSMGTVTEKLAGEHDRADEMLVYIKKKTSECKSNYEAVEANITEIKEKLLTEDIKDKLEGNYHRRRDDKRKAIGNLITVAAVVIATTVSVLTFINWKDKKNTGGSYSRSEAKTDKKELLHQIHKMIEANEETK